MHCVSAVNRSKLQATFLHPVFNTSLLMANANWQSQMINGGMGAGLVPRYLVPNRPRVVNG